MSQTLKVLRTLNDSNKKCIEPSNWDWLCKNVELLQISIMAEDCSADVFDIAEAWPKEGTILIQDGKKVQFKDDFHPGKEALLLIPYEDGSGYLVYRYLLKE